MVMSNWPKDDAGWPKKLKPAEEAVHLAGLSEEERHTLVGLGGSQKAEVAWLDKHDIPYEEFDVDEFGLKYLGMVAKEASRSKTRQKFNRKFTYSLFGGQVHIKPVLELCVVSFCGSANKFDFQVSPRSYPCLSHATFSSQSVSPS
jgi:hypothetical protein